MIYKTKADLLGKMWKSRSDVRLVDRMVARGEVKKVAEWYEVNEKFFIKSVNEYDKNMTLPDENLDNSTLITIKQDEYMNLKRARKGLALINKGYMDIIEKLIQYKKPEEKEVVREEVRQMVVGVKRELDK